MSKTELGVDLVLERVARAAGAGAERAAALDHEALDDPVEAEAVVVLLPASDRRRHGSRLGALGEPDEVLDGLGGVVREKVDDDVAAVGLQGRLGLGHELPFEGCRWSYRPRSSHATEGHCRAGADARRTRARARPGAAWEAGGRSCAWPGTTRGRLPPPGGVPRAHPVTRVYFAARDGHDLQSRETLTERRSPHAMFDQEPQGQVRRRGAEPRQGPQRCDRAPRREGQGRAAPRLARRARHRAAPHVENARDRLVNDGRSQRPRRLVNEAVENARDQAAPIAEEARRRGSLAVAAAKARAGQERTGREEEVLAAGRPRRRRRLRRQADDGRQGVHQLAVLLRRRPPLRRRSPAPAPARRRRCRAATSPTTSGAEPAER